MDVPGSDQHAMKANEIAPALGDFLRKPENRQFLEFYEYWRRKGAGRGPPSRADIDPLDIPRLLPGVFLVEVTSGPPWRFRFRLVGTRITELEGELTNRFLDEFIPGSPGTPMTRHYEETAQGRISLRHETLYWRGREHVNYDVLLLPLSSDGKAIDMLFGFARYHAK